MVGVFVNLDILRQVQTVTSVYRSTSGTSRFSSLRILEAEQKTSDRFKSSEMEKFSRKPAMTFSNVEIKTRDNNMVNKAFERTADFCHFDKARCDFQNNIYLLHVTHKF